MKCNVEVVWGFSLVTLFLIGLTEESKSAEQAAGRSPMPVYVTPFYDSKGPQIEVGKFSKALAHADAKSIDKVVADLKKEQDHLRAEVMYVAAIRLYDLGRKDAAVYWFYSAQYRSRLFNEMLDDAHVGSIGDEAFELRQAYGAFKQLAGMYINGYAFGDVEKLNKTLLSVAKEGETMPKMDELYPTVRFIAKDDWAKKNSVIGTELVGLVDYIKKNADSIKEQRKQNGIEGKY